MVDEAPWLPTDDAERRGRSFRVGLRALPMGTSKVRSISASRDPPLVPPVAAMPVDVFMTQSCPRPRTNLAQLGACVVDD